MQQRHTPNQQSNLHSKAHLSKHSRRHQTAPQVPTAQLHPAHNSRSSSSSKHLRKLRHPQARRGLRRAHRLKALHAMVTHPQVATATSNLAAIKRLKRQNLKAKLKDLCIDCEAFVKLSGKRCNSSPLCHAYCCSLHSYSEVHYIYASEVHYMYAAVALTQHQVFDNTGGVCCWLSCPLSEHQPHRDCTFLIGRLCTLHRLFTWYFSAAFVASFLTFCSLTIQPARTVEVLLSNFRCKCA